MTTTELTISVIAILIVAAIAWNVGGKDDVAALRDRWRRRGRGSPHRRDS